MMDDSSGGMNAALRRATQIVRTGLDPAGFHGFVNPPVVHASTVVYPDVEATIQRTMKYGYGRSGSPAVDALEAIVNELEGAERTVLAPTGLAACALALAAVVKAGDRVLAFDNVYDPTREFCAGFLSRFDVETVFVDPLNLDAIAAKLATPTAAFFLEAPGSLTFEMPDIPRICEMAKAAGAVTIMDNTWATPVFFQPWAHGVDLSIQAATKDFAGHSDLLLGTIAGRGKHIRNVRRCWNQWGMHVGPEDVYLTLRGMRTLDVRLERHARNTRRVAEWLSAQPELDKVLYPALPDAPGHHIWKRDFTGATGLFGITFKGVPAKRVHAFVEGLRLFPIGNSWGGFQSLVQVPQVTRYRSATQWPEDTHVVRLNIGLEDPVDLIEDLDQSLRTTFRT
ncbi:MAG: cystathionine beta-lyase [Pseudomonadota bacterium]